jgi:RNA polymerase sigma-70 factor (ECF subfamily)
MNDDGQHEELQVLRSEGTPGLAAVFSRYRERFRKMVRFRLDQRLWGRVDTDDVLQEAYLEAARRVSDYLEDPAVPAFVWLRRMTEQAIIKVHRQHLGAKMRDASLELAFHDRQISHATSVSLAAVLAANYTSPSEAAVREETAEELRAAFDAMDPIDREVLALRHFEELSNNEVAAVLRIQKAAASNRYVRALKRLERILARISS